MNTAFILLILDVALPLLRRILGQLPIAKQPALAKIIEDLDKFTNDVLGAEVLADDEKAAREG